jgi:hypothetical protein
MVTRRTEAKREAVRTREDWHSPEGRIRFAKRIAAELQGGKISRRRAEVLLRAQRVVTSAQRTLDKIKKEQKAKEPVVFNVKPAPWLQEMIDAEKRPS